MTWQQTIKIAARSSTRAISLLPRKDANCSGVQPFMLVWTRWSWEERLVTTELTALVTTSRRKCSPSLIVVKMRKLFMCPQGTPHPVFCCVQWN